MSAGCLIYVFLSDKTFLDTRQLDFLFFTIDSEIFGDIRKHVISCQVLPRENAMKLVGTPEGVQNSYDAARKLLVR